MGVCPERDHRPGPLPIGQRVDVPSGVGVRAAQERDDVDVHGVELERGLQQTHRLVDPTVPGRQLRHPSVRVGKAGIELHRPTGLPLGAHHVVLGQEESRKNGVRVGQPCVQLEGIHQTLPGPANGFDVRDRALARQPKETFSDPHSRTCELRVEALGHLEMRKHALERLLRTLFREELAPLQELGVRLDNLGVR